MSLVGEEFRVLETIRVGAESVISKVSWRGMLLVAKTRVPKPYRHPELDREVRMKRTINEARLMIKSKRLGVPCPALIHLEQTTCTIYMQYIDGRELREVLMKDPEEALEAAVSIGRSVALMHSGGMHHGDVVPSNIILLGGVPLLIDFGLSGFSKGIEEEAIDVHLLDRSIRGSFPQHVERFMEMFKQGYASVIGEGHLKRVERRVEEIRKRARYVER